MNRQDTGYRTEKEGVPAAGTQFETVADIVRQALRGGQTVEIEGLGVFRLATQNRDHLVNNVMANSVFEFIPETRPRVFIAYATEDLILARRLCEALRAEGLSPWLDKDKLLPGQNWPRAIERAIEISDAFVACFSPRSTAKRGQFQCELRYALDCASKRPLEETFLVPVRFEECTVPRRIADQVQYVDLFPDWQKGVNRIARAIRKTVPIRPIPELKP